MKLILNLDKLEFYNEKNEAFAGLTPEKYY